MRGVSERGPRWLASCTHYLLAAEVMSSSAKGVDDSCRSQRPHCTLMCGSMAAFQGFGGRSHRTGARADARTRLGSWPRWISAFQPAQRRRCRYLCVRPCPLSPSFSHSSAYRICVPSRLLLFAEFCCYRLLCSRPSRPAGSHSAAHDTDEYDDEYCQLPSTRCPRTTPPRFPHSARGYC